MKKPACHPEYSGRVRVPSAPQVEQEAPFFVMFHYVYIIQSERSGVFYKGYSSYPEHRLHEHNDGRSRYTAGKGPWKLVYLELMKDKTSALKREKQLKRSNSEYIRWLIKQPSNLVN